MGSVVSSRGISLGVELGAFLDVCFVYNCIGCVCEGVNRVNLILMNHTFDRRCIHMLDSNSLSVHTWRFWAKIAFSHFFLFFLNGLPHDMIFGIGVALKCIHYKRRAFWIFTLHQSNNFMGSSPSQGSIFFWSLIFNGLFHAFQYIWNFQIWYSWNYLYILAS